MKTKNLTMIALFVLLGAMLAEGGNVIVKNGQVNATANITAYHFFGDGSALTNIPWNYNQTAGLAYVSNRSNALLNHLNVSSVLKAGDVQTGLFSDSTSGFASGSADLMYTKNMKPLLDGLYSLGSAILNYDSAYINNIFSDVLTLTNSLSVAGSAKVGRLNVTNNINSRTIYVNNSDVLIGRENRSSFGNARKTVLEVSTWNNDTGLPSIILSGDKSRTDNRGFELGLYGQTATKTGLFLTNASGANVYQVAADGTTTYYSPVSNNIPTNHTAYRIYDTSNGAQWDISVSNDGTTAGNLYFSVGGMSGAMNLRSNGVPTFKGLTGTGNDYLCVNSVGQLYRSDTACA